MEGDTILQKIDGKVVDITTEKIYAIKGKRKRANGEEFIYKNYEVFIPYNYLEYAGITDHLYIYEFEGKIYLTSSQPDATVPMKKLSVHKQRGNKRQRHFKPEETANNTWKRFFIVPRKFFPYVSEDKEVVFTLDLNRTDIFSGREASIIMEVRDKE